jgi:hypothetical protein
MCAKVKFSSLEEARKRAAIFWIKKGKKIYPYRCPWCKKWHNTSLSPEEQKKEGLSTVLK